MFFSPRLLYPIFAVFSFAVASFATPVAKPETNLVARQSDVLSTVQSFQGTVSPLIDQLTQAAATGNDPSPVVDQLSAAFADATDKLNHFGPSALVDVDATTVINVSIDVVVKLVVAMSKISILDLAVFSKVDVFLSVFPKAIAVIKADIFVDIGKRIPISDLSIFVKLKLILTATVLGLVDVLGIVNV